MSLSNLAKCHVDHNNIQFICYGNKASFCKTCYRKHAETCASSRCGDLRRLCYSILERYEHFKLKATLLSFNPSPEQYTELKNLFGYNYTEFTKYIREHVDRKLPFMVLQMQNSLVNDLLTNSHLSVNSNSSVTTGFSYDTNKFDNLYPSVKQMMTKTAPEQKDWDYVVEKMNDITGLDNSLRDSSKKKSVSERSMDSASVPGCRGKEAIDVRSVLLQLAKNIRTQLEYNLNVRDEFDFTMNTRLMQIIQDLSKTYIPTAYEVTENMTADELKFELDVLQKNPDELIEATKHLMKKSLFTENAKNTGSPAGSFPYRYCYPISTCVAPDLNYEKLVLNLQRKLVESIQTIDQTNGLRRTLDQLTKRILVIGPEVVEIEISQQKQLKYFRMNIYGYAEDRQAYYSELPKLLGIDFDNKNIIDCTPDANKQKYSALPSSLDTAYHNIEIANSLIFKEHFIESETGRRDEGKRFVRSLFSSGKPVELERRKMDEFLACFED